MRTLITIKISSFKEGENLTKAKQVSCLSLEKIITPAELQTNLNEVVTELRNLDFIEGVKKEDYSITIFINQKDYRKINVFDKVFRLSLNKWSNYIRRFHGIFDALKVEIKTIGFYKEITVFNDEAEISISISLKFPGDIKIENDLIDDLTWILITNVPKGKKLICQMEKEHEYYLKTATVHSILDQLELKLIDIKDELE